MNSTFQVKNGPFKTVNQKSQFIIQVNEIIEANGWNDDLRVEEVSNEQVRITLGPNHPICPGEFVNDYYQGMTPFEQIQSECLRALRTGRTGI